MANKFFCSCGITITTATPCSCTGNCYVRLGQCSVSQPFQSCGTLQKKICGTSSESMAICLRLTPFSESFFNDLLKSISTTSIPDFEYCNCHPRCGTPVGNYWVTHHDLLLKALGLSPLVTLACSTAW